jgi:hypothetical protein
LLTTKRQEGVRSMKDFFDDFWYTINLCFFRT